MLATERAWRGVNEGALWLFTEFLPGVKGCVAWVHEGMHGCMHNAAATLWRLASWAHQGRDPTFL